MAGEIDLGFHPRDHQGEAHRKRKRFSVLVWHRRSGKTVYAVIELVLGALLCLRPRGRFAYVAPLYRQAKAVAWDYAKAYARRIPGVVIFEAELAIRFPNGAEVRLFGADNPDSLRGLYFDGIVLDEVADMRPQVWGEIIRPALTDREGWALFIGTPKGHNLFSETYYSALKDPEWFADLKRASDTNAIDPAEIERARKEMAPSQFAQEFDCDFAAAVENALVPLDSVLSAQRRVLDRTEYATDARVMGVDVARYGDDRSVIALRQGRKAMPFRVWRDLDLMTLSGNVSQCIEELHPDAVFVDQTGIGAGVVDRLRQLGRRVFGVDFGGKPMPERFSNKRAEMWWLMADWVKTAQLPDAPELVGELTGVTYSYANAAGRLQLESKEDLKKRGLPSPDLADALALTFAEPVAHPGFKREVRVERAFGSVR